MQLSQPSSMRNVVQLTDVAITPPPSDSGAGGVACMGHSEGVVYHLMPEGTLCSLVPGTSHTNWSASLPPSEHASKGSGGGWVFAHASDQLGGVLCASTDGQMAVVHGESQEVEAIGEFEGVRARSETPHETRGTSQLHFHRAF